MAHHGGRPLAGGILLSLSDHARAGAGHGALPFHPACPACRSERLSGSMLTDEPVVSARVRAALVAALLAGSAALPSAAAAQDPADDEAPPSQVEAGQDPAEAELGEEETGDENPPPDLGVTPPSLDDGAGAPPAAPPPAAEAPEEEPEPEAAAPAPAPAPAPPPAAPAPPPAPSPAAPAKPASPAPPKPRRHEARKKAATHAAPAKPLPTPAPAPAPSPAPVDSPSGHVYVVQSGDSLWSIAARVLGPGATSARIAREVNRLWDLNAARIRSGSPGLIQPGERLQLF